MKYLVFTDPEKAEARNQKAFADGMQAGRFAQGTTGYAELVPNRDGSLYALLVDTKYRSLFTPDELQQAGPLPADWFQAPGL